MLKAKKPAPVLFLIDDLNDWRGTETHLFRLFQVMDRNRILPILAVIGRAKLANEFLSIGIRVEHLAFYKIFGLAGLRGLKKIIQLLNETHAKLIVTYHTSSDLLGPLSALFVNNVRCLSCRRDEGFTKKNVHVKLQRHLNRFVTGMISVSHAVATAVNKIEGFSEDKIQVIWNGEDITKFTPVGPNCRRELNIPLEAHVLICVAGLVAIKDHFTLLRAFRSLRDKFLDLFLLVVGDGPEKNNLQTEFADLKDSVFFLGHRDDIPDLLRTCDIYVQTSLSEGFSNAIVQAMACGLPIVATSVGGNNELINSDCGYLVHPKCPKKTAEVLEILLVDENLRKKMGKLARLRVEVNCSIEEMAREYIDVLESVIS
ncbi:glycosyltransferase [Thermodesulfobacteriota bacterium]